MEVVGGDKAGGAPLLSILSLIMPMLHDADGDAVEVVIARFW